MQVDEWVVGQEYEFRDDVRIWEKRKLLAVLPEEYKNRYIATSVTTPQRWTSMSEIRNINKPKFNDKKPHIEQHNKEILDQIEAFEKELENLKSKIK